MTAPPGDVAPDSSGAPTVSPPEPDASRPRVVLVRPTDVETDSRAKKIGVSLGRLGYDVIVLGRSGTGRRREGQLATARVVLVVPQSRLRGSARRVVRLRSRRMGRLEKWINERVQLLERAADKRLRAWEKGGAYLFYAAQRDFRTTYGSELVKFQPHVIHVHDPRLLPVAFRARERISRRTGRGCEVIYDARENFAGVLETRESLPRYHARVLDAERRFASRAASVLTVSDDVAAAVSGRTHLAHPPFVLLNTPVLKPIDVTVDTSGAPLRSLRDDARVPDGAPILVYPGAASRARGVDTIVEALPSMPGVHAVLVVVPYPHPRASELMDAARRLGVADRLHLVPPVGSDDVPRYLSGADVAVHPMLGGIPNHEMALPNKLFEIMHARVPMASSSVRRMSRFVLDHGMGRVFTAGDPAALADVVNELIAERRAGTAPLASRATVTRYSWQAQEAPLAAAYARAATPGPARGGEPFPEVVVDWD